VSAYDLHPRITPPTSDEVVTNGDGTFTLPDPDGGDWLVSDTGRGWAATHPDDGFEGVTFLTAEDAIRAVLDYPGPCRLFGGGTYGETVGGAR
jgi:hypothetical protein